MTARRGATDLAGLLVIDKPAGMTSHAVVNVIRRATGERRVGHAGTLDPAATGVLVVLVGPYTRLEQYLSADTKSYRAVLRFGSETDTDDAEGEVLRTSDIPVDTFNVAKAHDVLHAFSGPQTQTPPSYSAIKRDGRTAHRVARAGGHLQVEPREITVHDTSLVSVDPETGTWTVDFVVSKGTYIRALARDIGRYMGTAAHLCALRRTASGSMTLETAIPLASLDAVDVRSLFSDPVPALGFPVLEADEVQSSYVADGRPIEVSGVPDGRVSVVRDGALLGIYVAGSGRLSAETVLGARK